MQRKKMDSQNVKMDSQPVRARMPGRYSEIGQPERNKEYGEPRQNMARTAALMAAIWATVQAARSVPKMAAFNLLKLEIEENPHKLTAGAMWQDMQLLVKWQSSSSQGDADGHSASKTRPNPRQESGSPAAVRLLVSKLSQGVTKQQKGIAEQR